MSKQAMVLAAALAQAGVGWSQSLGDERGAGDAPQLETVTVNARRSIEERFFAAGSLVVVDRRDIEQLGAFSVADVLRQLPGVQVNAGGDGSVEIRMRGMERSATQLLVDGQRVSGGRSQLPLDQLPSELIERIEVVRAPTAEFSGATGGTLNIVLRQATVRRETQIRLTDNHVWGRNAGQAFFSRSGPLGTAQPPTASAADAAAANIHQPWSYFLALASTGYVLGSDTERTVQEAGGTTTTDTTARYRRNELSIVPRLSGRLGPADQLALRATLSQSRFSGESGSAGRLVAADGSVTPLASLETQDQERRFLQFGADWTHRFAGSKLETTLAGSQARESVDRLGTPLAAAGAAADTYAFGDRRQENLWSLGTKLTGTRSALLWSAGAQTETRRLGVDNQSGAGLASLDAVLERQVLWGQNEWEVFGGSTLTAGLRGETLRIESGAAAVPVAQRRTSFLQPSLHLRTRVSEQLQFRANLARVTRNPRVWDLLDRSVPSQGRNSLSNPDSAGNPGLRPETAWTLDTGFERRLGDLGQAGANLFVRRTEDTIAPTLTLAGGRWVEQRVNIGDALVWGLELDAKTGLAWLGLASDWTLSANASLLQSRMTSGINRGERIPGQARYTASMTVAKPVRRSGGLFGGATLALTGPADLNTAPGFTGRDGARAMLDLYIGNVVRGLGYWRVGVFNVGDALHERQRSYVDASGAARQADSRMRLTPRLYLTVGTQF